MLTNCLAACAHLTIGRKSSFFHTPLAFDAPVRGFPVGIAPPRLVCKKTRMAWLPDGEKNFEDIFIRFDMIHERDRQTDRQTPRAGIYRAYS